MNSSRETILNKLREKKAGSLPLFSHNLTKNTNPFITPTNDLVNHFKTELEKIGGKCFICNDSSNLNEQFRSLIEEKKISEIYCSNTEILEQLNKSNISFAPKIEDYNTIQATITPCDFLSARTGSVIVTSTLIQGRVDIVFPPIHIVIANESQLFPDLDEVIVQISIKYKDDFPSQITCITGQSRTADIEKTLILGAHGPKEIFVFLLKKDQH